MTPPKIEEGVYEMPSDPTYENAAQQPGIPENTQVNDNIYKEFDNPLYS